MERKAWAPEISAIRFIKAIRQKKIIIRRNKWRDDPGLTFENHKFKGYLGSGAWGDVLLVINTETNKHYALKLLLNLTKFDRSDTLPQGALEPPLTASSDATKSSSHSVERLSLRAKRNEETRIFLRYIRNGHAHICNLEAFVQYKPGYGDEEFAMGLYFEYCDAGNLSILSKKFRTRGIKPPELFIWQVFYEMISGIAFLHNEHPDYNTKSENTGREAIFHNDIRSKNVFLQWGPDKEGGYPHVKIGDFGTSFTEPPGGHVPDPEYDSPTSQDEVWWVAAAAYELGRTGVVLDNILNHSLQRRREEFLKIDPIDGHLSESLDQVIRGTLTPEVEKRPFSGALYLDLKNAFEERVGLMYRKLPDWAGEKTLTHVSDEDMMKELDEGGLEIELGVGGA
ncbi:hypothetical protein OCU04_004656 [Sclerotinia nivalis]|uniref:EKC/KEOPS complex subunit BUD32 n=1 Tax=Sclerotinia nivalis TaxID=352851 RepID=A0A9X0AR85_9HELO|nr:hypothetical protein OCU04_004656 [Sclerotinia nivalis]